jgi:synaptotagmin-like protein
VYEHLTIEEVMDRALEVTVWDWDRGASNDFLGGTRLGMGAKVEKWDDSEGEEIAAWQKMLDNHNEWNECTISLRSSMHSR